MKSQQYSTIVTTLVVAATCMVTTIVVTATSVVVFGKTSHTSQTSSAVSQGDRAFLTDIAEANLAEIELGKLAQQKGNSAEVRDFGSSMVEDHTALNNQLKEVAAKLNVALPTEASAKDRELESHLTKLSGQGFEKAYIEAMLADHRADVKTLQQKAENAQNMEVKHFAERTLPILENHLRIAENDAGRSGIAARKGLNEPEHPKQ